MVQDSNRNVIYYGMSRDDAERILGAGAEHSVVISGRNFYQYDDGDIAILYRNDSVVLVIVEVPGWSTPSGVEVGTTATRLHELYNFYLCPDIGCVLQLYFNYDMEPIDIFEEWAYSIAFRTALDGEENEVVTVLSFGDFSASMRLE